MKTISTFGVVVGCLGLLASVVAGDDAVNAAQEQIRTSYEKQIVDAYRKHDIKTLARHYAPDLKIKQKDGTMRDLKAQLEFNRQDMEDTANIRSARLEFHKSTLKGNTLISDVSEVWDNDWRDRNGDYGPKGKVYPILWRGRSIATHAKTPQGWVLKRSEVKSDVITTGGKPMGTLLTRKKK